MPIARQVRVIAQVRAGCAAHWTAERRGRVEKARPGRWNCKLECSVGREKCFAFSGPDDVRLSERARHVGALRPARELLSGWLLREARRSKLAKTVQK